MTSSATSTPPTRRGSKLLFDLTGIDLDAVVGTRDDVAKVNPHRGCMALLDAVVWISSDMSQAIAKVQVRGDEFWAAGHFPGKPLFPGVLMIESGAQLANYLFNVRTPIENICALLAVDEARFRTPVEPGQTLYILLQSVKWTAKRFTCRVQGVVNDTIAFECSVSGIAINSKKQ